MCGLLNLRRIFQCRQKLQEQQASRNDEPLQERETAQEECPTTPHMEKHRKSQRATSPKDLFSNTDSATFTGKTLHKESKNYLSISQTRGILTG